MLRVGSLKRKKKGQRTCSDCGKTYNNACVPSNCECGYELGGTFRPKTVESKIYKDAQVINSNLVSVRLHEKGPNIRTFVSLDENKVCKLLYSNVVFSKVS